MIPFARGFAGVVRGGLQIIDCAAAFGGCGFVTVCIKNLDFNAGLHGVVQIGPAEEYAAVGSGGMFEFEREFKIFELVFCVVQVFPLFCGAEKTAVIHNPTIGIAGGCPAVEGFAVEELHVASLLMCDCDGFCETFAAHGARSVVIGPQVFEFKFCFDFFYGYIFHEGFEYKCGFGAHDVDADACAIGTVYVAEFVLVEVEVVRFGICVDFGKCKGRKFALFYEGFTIALPREAMAAHVGDGAFLGLADDEKDAVIARPGSVSHAAVEHAGEEDHARTRAGEHHGNFGKFEVKADTHAHATAVCGERVGLCAGQGAAFHFVDCGLHFVVAAHDVSISTDEDGCVEGLVFPPLLHADDDMGANFRGCFANGFGCGAGYGFTHPGFAILRTAEFSRDFGEAYKVGAVRGCFFEVAHHVFYVLFYVFVPTSGE